jgi:nucleoside-diphosphate-sugar epimerase
MTSIIITGGTGFVGHWLQQTQFDFFHGLHNCSYLSSLGYKEQWEDRKIDYIIHAANISPTRAINAARKKNCRLLYVSSGAAYDQSGEYADNKRRWEQECQDSGVDVVVARLFCFFGDRLDDGKAYTQFMRAARAGTPLRVWGDGNIVRSYLHGRDLGRQMWAILLRGERGEIYDVGSDKPTTILRLAQRIASARLRCLSTCRVTRLRRKGC